MALRDTNIFSNVYYEKRLALSLSLSCLAGVNNVKEEERLLAAAAASSLETRSSTCEGARARLLNMAATPPRRSIGAPSCHGPCSRRLLAAC